MSPRKPTLLPLQLNDTVIREPNANFVGMIRVQKKNERSTWAGRNFNSIAWIVGFFKMIYIFTKLGLWCHTYEFIYKIFQVTKKKK